MHLAPALVDASNRMCPAGLSSTEDSNYSQFWFSTHVVVGDSGERFDSSSSYKHNVYGAIHRNPAAPFPYPEFWQNIINSVPNGLVATPSSAGTPVLIDRNALGHVASNDW